MLIGTYLVQFKLVYSKYNNNKNKSEKIKR